MALELAALASSSPELLVESVCGAHAACQPQACPLLHSMVEEAGNSDATTIPDAFEQVFDMR